MATAGIRINVCGHRRAREQACLADSGPAAETAKPAGSKQRGFGTPRGEESGGVNVSGGRIEH